MGIEPSLQGATGGLHVPLLMIGRGAELALLARWREEAAAGEQRIVLLRGEAGIGKSRLVEEFVTQCDDRTLVLRGRCHEDASVPYLPLAGALDELVPGWSTTRRTSTTPEQTAGDDRLGWFLDASRALIEAAVARPVVVVVDDLHWSDRSTIELLSHLLTSVALDERSPRLLMVLVHRPIIGEPSIASMIERLRREPHVRELELESLEPAVVHALVAAAAGREPSRQLVHDLMEATGGNPYLVLSQLRRLESFGALRYKGGRLVSATDAEVHPLPPGLDTLLKERIDGLSRPTQQTLTLAAFLGDDIELSDLAIVSGVDREALLAHGDEAIAAELLVEEASRWRFSHPQVRQLLYHGPGRRRSRQLHVRIADRLEAAGRLDEAALTIAHHLMRAGPEVETDRLTRIGVMAADQAASIGAWGEATALYEAVLDATASDATGPSGFHAVLHHRAAFTAAWDHDDDRAIAHARRAVEIARQLGDFERWGLAAVEGCRAAFPASQRGELIDLEPLYAFLDAAGDAYPEVRAQVLAELARALVDMGRLPEAVDHALAAQPLVATSPDRRITRSVDSVVGFARLAGLELDEARAVYERAGVLPAPDDERLPATWALNQLGLTHWLAGRLGPAEQVLTDAANLARSSGSWYQLVNSFCWLTGIAAARGDRDATEKWAHEAASLARWVDDPTATLTALPALAAARAATGDRDGADAALDEMQARLGRDVRRYRVLANVMAGDVARAVAVVGDRPLRPPPLAPVLTLYTVGLAAITVAIAVALDDPALATPVREPLAAAAARGLVHVPDWPLDVPDLVRAAGRLGERADPVTE